MLLGKRGRLVKIKVDLGHAVVHASEVRQVGQMKPRLEQRAAEQVDFLGQQCRRSIWHGPVAVALDELLGTCLRLGTRNDGNAVASEARRGSGHVRLSAQQQLVSAAVLLGTLLALGKAPICRGHVRSMSSPLGPSAPAFRNGQPTPRLFVVLHHANSAMRHARANAIG